eukprot:ctg_2006.g539
MSSVHPPQHQRGERVIAAKVRLGGQIAGDRHPVESPVGKGVPCTQQLVKVVRPEIVAHKAEHRVPHVGLDVEAIPPATLTVSRTRPPRRTKHTRQCHTQRHHRVPGAVQLAIPSGGHDAEDEKGDGERSPEDEEALGVCFRGVRCPRQLQEMGMSHGNAFEQCG